MECFSTGISGLTTLHTDDTRKIPDRILNMVSDSYAANRMINDVYTFINVGILIRKKVVDNRIIRNVDQICLFDRDNDTNTKDLIVENGTQVSQKIPDNLLKRFRRAGIEDPFVFTKKVKEKKMHFWNYLNFKKMQAEVNRYGMSINMTDYLKFIGLSYLAMIAFCYVFKLRWLCIAAVAVVITLLLPSIFMAQFRNMYETKRFEDVNSYLEQMLYSFRRQPKILIALQDTLVLFSENTEGGFYKVINEAIQYIQAGQSQGDIYREAFSIIEAEYGCKKMEKVHNFMMKVEQDGGECEGAIEILLLDLKLWVDRMFELIQEKQKIKVNVTIAIGLSLLIVGMAIYMIPSSFNVTNQWLSQIATTVSLLLDVFIWYFVQNKLSGNLINVDRDEPFEEIKPAYDLVMHGEERNKKSRRNALIAAVAIFVAAAACAATFSVQVGVAMMAFGVLIAIHPKRHFKHCFKRVSRAIEKAFPEWLLSLSLQMQTDNVHVSIMKTTGEAPEILREELRKLSEGVDKNPGELKPYIDFMYRFHIADITSAMKMLYSMAEFGAQDAQEQIHTLVERNTSMMARAEKMRMEDSLAGITITMLLPMITGVLKMIVDLGLVMWSILQISNLL